jgi:uncharacterized protein
MENELNPEILLELKTAKMPFGKHKDKLLVEIPVSYLEWMATKGFPKGKLGMLLNTLHVIKTNGLMDLLKQI